MGRTKKRIIQPSRNLSTCPPPQGFGFIRPLDGDGPDVPQRNEWSMGDGWEILISP